MNYEEHVYRECVLIHIMILIIKYVSLKSNLMLM